ncbi:hypothetical protein EJ02DRAFT_491606 [Clathrospora elynae]|uniref:F-box domain-containing protein n=1 Tax=Clathrospora elynae TaxID=706981 RepID=A0A6A5SAP1_9PLEO|nr:hypothetical protein EJ02DRAFT_491606 [Clathrospora elynae]
MHSLLDLPRELRDEILDFAICNQINFETPPRPYAFTAMQPPALPPFDQHPAQGLLSTCHQLRAETLQRNGKQTLTLYLDAHDECLTAPCTSILMPIQVGPIVEDIVFNFRLRPVCFETIILSLGDHGVPRASALQYIQSDDVYINGLYNIASQLWGVLLQVVRKNVVLWENYDNSTPPVFICKHYPRNLIRNVHVNFFTQPGAHEFVCKEAQHGRHFGVLRASDFSGAFDYYLEVGFAGDLGRMNWDDRADQDIWFSDSSIISSRVKTFHLYLDGKWEKEMDFPSL